MNNALAATKGLAAPAASSSRNLSLRQSVLLVIGVAVGMCGGYTALFASTTGVFLLPVAHSLASGREAASAVMSLSLLGLAVGSPLTGMLMDRYGVRAVVSASVILFAAALVWLAAGSVGTATLSLKVFALGLVGVATSPVGYLPILTRTFDRRLGLALGLASVGLGAGSAASPIFAAWAIGRFGWQMAYLVLAGSAVALGVVALYLVFGSPWFKYREGDEVTMRLDTTPGGELTGDTATASLTTGRFWLMSFSLALISAVGIGNMVHIPALFHDHGVARPLAAAGATFTAIGVMCGRLCCGALLDVMKARYVAALIFVAGAVGIGLLADAGPLTPYAVLALGAALTGLLIGAEGDLMPYLVRRYFGLKSFGIVYGLLVSLFSLGGLAGPIIYGAAYDHFGSYTVVLTGGVVACLIGALGILSIGPHRYEVDLAR